jgi:hypothetical protein
MNQLVETSLKIPLKRELWRGFRRLMKYRGGILPESAFAMLQIFFALVILVFVGLFVILALPLRADEDERRV